MRAAGSAKYDLNTRAWLGAATLAISLTAAFPAKARVAALEPDNLKTGSISVPNAKKRMLKPDRVHGEVGTRRIDMNFDGVMDLAIMRAGGLSAHIKPVYFLFDREERRFTRSSALNRLNAPEFDPESKMVKSVSRAPDNRKITEFYVWNGNHLRLKMRQVTDLGATTCIEIHFDADGQRQSRFHRARC